MPGTQRYFDPSQPQTLQIATLLLYLNGVFSALGGGIGIVLAAAYVGGGFGIANGRKWGYGLGVGIAIVGVILAFGLVNLLFSIALVALLVHPESREYQRIWFS